MEVQQINALIGQVAKGDENALTILYQQLSGRLLSVALGITGDRQLAEDALQDAFIKIVRHASLFRRNDNGYGWICTIVRNQALTIIKKRKTTVSTDEFHNLAETIPSSENNERRIEVNMALEKLAPDERKLIWYKYFCDMTVREIEKATGISKTTVAKRINQAEEKLRNLLI